MLAVITPLIDYILDNKQNVSLCRTDKIEQTGERTKS